MKRRNFLQASSLLPFISLKPNRADRDHVMEINTQNLMNGIDKNRAEFFYKPADAWAADFIPLFAEGEFQLFYLLDWRDQDKHGEGTPWYRISTKDFVHFTEHGEMLPRGTKDEQDLYVFTGSALHANNQYHIFYTGHNGHFVDQGKPQEAVMHAVSDDLKSWKKFPEQTFFAPADRFEPNDWRDPFVFWNEDDKEFNMLVAARFKKGVPRRRGLTGLCVSKDLIHWTVKEPFYAPNLYYTHECPDLFKMGEWWYLLFSEFTDKVKTRYRMSRSLKGPWVAPALDDFDGHAFYAAKTASDGKRRFIFGWNPTRDNAKDNGGWNWGGNLVVHEIHQEPDGTLSVRVPDTVNAAFSKYQTLSFLSGVGNYTIAGERIDIHAEETYGAVSAGKMPETCKINATVIFEKHTKECGLMIRTSDDFESAYYLKLEPANHKFVFDMWPRNNSEVTQMIELDRDIDLIPGKPVHIQVFIDGNKGVAYVDNIIAMNFRAYDLASGNLCVFVSEGNASFSDVQISTL